MKVMARVLHVSPSLKKHDAVWLALAMLIAILTLHVKLNSVDISEKYFWLDESTTYELAKLPFLEAAEKLPYGHMQPPLFYWLAHIVISVDDSPAVLRGISFVFIAGTLAFVVLALKELSLSSRLVLSLLLTLSPYAQYASIEFRPYGMAVFFILLSSVFLYRALGQRQRWGPAVVYGLFGLGLQYSLTLNCWVFGCQMFAVGTILALQIKTEGLRHAVKSSRALLAVCVLLSISYLPFLISVSRFGDVHISQIPNWVDWTYGARLADNFKKELYPEIILVSNFWWINWIAIALFITGVGLSRNRMAGITAYWVMIFVGQLAFSTYITYRRISWFHQGYLSSSYVAFAFLSALGYERLIALRWPSYRSLVPAIIVFVLIFPGVTENARRIPINHQNKYRMIIDELRCPDKRNLVFCSPEWDCSIVDYEYRDSDTVKVFRHLSPEYLERFDEDAPCVLYIKDKAKGQVAIGEDDSARLVERHSMEALAFEFLRQESRYNEKTFDLHQRFQDSGFPDYLFVFRPNPETDP
jgi:hypothetical protein